MGVLSRVSAQIAAGDLGPRAAVHLLNRVGYGPQPGDTGRVLKQGLEDYLEEQLEAPPDPDLDARLRGLTTLRMSLPEASALYAADQGSAAALGRELLSAKIIRSVHARNQLQEVLVDFWFNHFNVNIADGYDRVATAFYERDAIRPHVLGKFPDLLGATAAHPAMLYYLDNYLSTASRVDPRTGRLILGLNENYGRELLELHTVGVDAGYTQEHVFDASRCFTGWTIDFRRGAFLFRAENHDKNAKSVFGLEVPAGGGQSDGEKLLQYLAFHDATAHFVSRKLCQRFVSDDPPVALVARCARAYQSTEGDIREVMRTILGSAEFWYEAFGAGKAKTPLEYAASALRAVDAEVSNGGPVAGHVSTMGMPLYQCLPPTGYSARGADWLNPSSHLARMNFALDLVSGGISGVSVDAARVARSSGASPDDPRSVATALSAQIFGRGLSAQTLDVASRVSRTGVPSVAARVAGVVLASPEMQVR